MLSFLRSSANVLLVESSKDNLLENYLIKKHSAIKTKLSSALANSSEHNTIVLILDKMKPLVEFSDPKSVLTVPLESDILLVNIIKDKKNNLIQNIRLAPKTLVMRVFGDEEKVINKFKEHYDCNITYIPNIWEEFNSGTLITLTKRPLHNTLSINDLYKKSIYIDKSYTEIERSLRIRALEYLNAGLNKKDWCELDIKIYDAYEEYKLHYERLLHIVESLELGLILGESWGKDTVSIFRAVKIYRLKLFTFYQPEYIKKILIGLEHLQDGTRIVDYDLFYKRKKISWTSLKDRNKMSKDEIGKIMRSNILSKLNDVEKEINEKFEEKIKETRF
ncbi:MAG: hypothetical protein FH753_10710 [Firmicutes bacterium]|nr:hypothetical protein [Bacillota bacterium]